MLTFKLNTIRQTFNKQFATSEKSPILASSKSYKNSLAVMPETPKMKIKLITIIGILTLFFSCKNYTIPVESFRKQMTEPGNEKLREVEINNPAHYSHKNIKYEANSIESIIVLDKNGNKVKLENSPKLEMRITRKSGKKYVLLFDTVIVENDTLKGARSRIMKNLTREIPLNDIEHIMIQDSGKVYKYQ